MTFRRGRAIPLYASAHSLSGRIRVGHNSDLAYSNKQRVQFQYNYYKLELIMKSCNKVQ